MRYFFLFFCLLMAGCTHRPQPHKVSIYDTAIHKKWKFVKFDAVNRDITKDILYKTNGSAASLDIRRPDSLSYIPEDAKDPAVTMAYSVVNDTLLMRSKYRVIPFKIWRLLPDEMVLVIPAQKNDIILGQFDNLTVMVFKAVSQ